MRRRGRSRRRRRNSKRRYWSVGGITRRYRRDIRVQSQGGGFAATELPGFRDVQHRIIVRITAGERSKEIVGGIGRCAIVVNYLNVVKRHVARVANFVRKCDLLPDKDDRNIRVGRVVRLIAVCEFFNVDAGNGTQIVARVPIQD